MNAHILVVEDDLLTRITLARLIQLAGYQVTQAADGETAIDLLEREVFNVILTDIVMGAIDGIEVLHTARLQPYRPNVILLTGHGTLETAIAALRYGAFDYLLKPCHDEILIASLERGVQHHADEHSIRQAAALIMDYYQRPSGSQTAADNHILPGPTTTRKKSLPVIHIGALFLGPTRHEVTFEHRTLQLTPIEFELLRFLAETPGTVRDCRDIVRHTHRFDADEAEAQMLVKQHIRNLRKKLPGDYLVNMRGIGYKLDAPQNDPTDM